MPEDCVRDELITQLAKLERERSELVARLSTPSAPPALLIRREHLDEVIAALRARLASLPDNVDST